MLKKWKVKVINNLIVDVPVGLYTFSRLFSRYKPKFQTCLSRGEHFLDIWVTPEILFERSLYLRY
ncbi:hypothetical protein HanRHA438_Chr17g0835851 [Helianthus annuus]|nr:hypothetical protein HanRHA438_Chr17g0835851 [Helianthus annuus]